TVRIPVGTVVSSSVIWKYIIYCENTPFLARNIFNHVPVLLKA
ncbi:hypothetical protein AS27_07462, partial [Aptenodytes forsteri]